MWHFIPPTLFYRTSSTKQHRVSERDRDRHRERKRERARGISQFANPNFEEIGDGCLQGSRELRLHRQARRAGRAIRRLGFPPLCLRLTRAHRCAWFWWYLLLQWISSLNLLCVNSFAFLRFHFIFSIFPNLDYFLPFTVYCQFDCKEETREKGINYGFFFRFFSFFSNFHFLILFS